MLSLTYQIEIDASPQEVWQRLTDAGYYRQWAIAFSPESQFEGNWASGEEVIFFDPNLGGSRAVVDRAEMNRSLAYHHVSIFTPDHVQDVDSDIAMKWIGSSEAFEITEQQKGVILRVNVTTHPDFTAMFNSGWEKALPLIKLLCEGDNT
ncbi:SRPBCC family protein [Vibrio mexicanus]|uniref:SRPBCC family protein n=1 Tax=Vibrio mexicanus TaxID=1004326 RepID=UPI00063CD479|nr:SRPBCC domain-containing protein [Vibrio mexicanus]